MTSDLMAEVLTSPSDSEAKECVIFVFKATNTGSHHTGVSGRREAAQSYDKGNRRNFSRSAKIQGLSGKGEHLQSSLSLNASFSGY